MQSTKQRQLEQLRHDVEHWRKTRAKLGQMPAPLWQGVTTLSRSLGVQRVARTLGLNYTAVKDRVVSAAASGAKRRGTARSQPTKTGEFIEVNGAALLGRRTDEGAIVVEVVGAEGERMIVRSSHGVDVVALVQAFRGRR